MILNRIQCDTNLTNANALLLATRKRCNELADRLQDIRMKKLFLPSDQLDKIPELDEMIEFIHLNIEKENQKEEEILAEISQLKVSDIGSSQSLHQKHVTPIVTNNSLLHISDLKTPPIAAVALAGLFESIPLAMSDENKHYQKDSDCDSVSSRSSRLNSSI